MQQQLIRRVLLVIPTLVGITIVVFAAVRFLPGDVVDQMTGDIGSGAASPETRAAIEERYSLNEGIPQQYAEWTSDLLVGDLGTSIVSGRPVREEIQKRIGISAELGVMAMIVSLVIAIPIGILSAVRQDTPWDYASRSISIGFLAIPNFWLALMVLIYGFNWFGWTPPLRYMQFWDDPVSNLQSVWVPALILGTSLSGTVMRLTRSMMLEVMRQDYVRTATAKGLGQWTVISRHAVRNAMIPVITVIGLQIPVIIGGTVILERIFSIPGMGSYLLDSISRRDYPVVQGIVLISAAAVVLSNLFVDIAYSLLDPRIKVQ